MNRISVETIHNVTTRLRRISAKQILVNACKKMQWTPPFCFRQSFQVSLVCMHVRTLVYLFVCFPVLRACMLPEGKQAVWGVICFYRGWQLITNPDKHWGRGEGREGGEMTNEREREERRGEEMALGRGIGIWIPQSNHTALRILSSQPLYESGPELDHCGASHLAHWQLINPHPYRYTTR